MKAHRVPVDRQNQRQSDLARLVGRAERYIAAGELAAAASVYHRALSMAPDHPDLHRTLGLVRLQQGRRDLALFHIGRSIEIHPHNAVSYRSMGDALAASGLSALAVASYGRACSIDPGYTDAWLNLGNLFHELDRYRRARSAYEKIIELTPDHLQALNNLGKVHHDMGRLDSSMAYYQRCLALNPDYAEARFNRAALLLSMGEYQQGWSEYEWRFKRSGSDSVYPHRLHTPRWQGESYRGKRLLVHCEQGMGDMLQFARFLPMVKELGGTLILEAHAPLAPLFKSQTCIDALLTFDARRPPELVHDVHIPLMSLPRIFGTTIETIPHKTPYITIRADGSAAWRACIDPDKINIGLVWAASDLNPKRNCPIEDCEAWFKNPALHFLSLQKGKAADRIDRMSHSRPPVTDLGARLHNFHDTASVLAHLDLIISVDTATAHLAGAMGKPLWVLLPHNADWRWMPQCENSPWYPSARLFRQTCPGNWNDVIEDVAAALGTC